MNFCINPKHLQKLLLKEYLNASNAFLDESQTKYLNALLDKISKKLEQIMNEFALINKYLKKLTKNNIRCFKIKR